MKYFKMVEVDITCWIIRYENEIETRRVICIKKSLNVVFMSVSVKDRTIVELCVKTLQLATYSGKPYLGYSITRTTTRALGVERWQE
jgi:hypothetical protein